jgi:hypothetical protein
MRWKHVIIIALPLVIAGFGLWRALQLPTALMIAPGAVNIQVRRSGIGEQVITYQAPGSAYSWRLHVAGELAAQGWVLPEGWRADMPTFNYSHISAFWLGAILEQADLDGEPNFARITVRRWVKLSCLLLGPSNGRVWNVRWLRSCVPVIRL